jgi:hypothetical protein
MARQHSGAIAIGVLLARAVELEQEARQRGLDGPEAMSYEGWSEKTGLSVQHVARAVSSLRSSGLAEVEVTVRYSGDVSSAPRQNED